MDFVEGPTLQDGETMSDIDSSDLTTALVSLASHGLVYTDFRRQNVIRSRRDRRIRLIDYDDMRLVEPLQPEFPASHGATDMDMNLEIDPGPQNDMSVVRGAYDVVLRDKVSSDSAFDEWVKAAVRGAFKSSLICHDMRVNSALQLRLLGHTTHKPEKLIFAATQP